MTCAPSEDSDKPVHPPSLIRVFAVHSVAQADLSLCWVHRSFCWFCHAQALMSFVTTASPLTGNSGDHDHNRPAKRMAHAPKALWRPADSHRSCVLQDISLGDITIISPARHSGSFQMVICPHTLPRWWGDEGSRYKWLVHHKPSTGPDNAICWASIPQLNR